MAWSLRTLSEAEHCLTCKAHFWAASEICDFNAQGLANISQVHLHLASVEEPALRPTWSQSIATAGNPQAQNVTNVARVWATNQIIDLLLMGSAAPTSTSTASLLGAQNVSNAA